LNDGKHCVVEYEPDSALRDTELVPLLYSGGMEAFYSNVVQEFDAFAWLDTTKSEVGYEIPFPRYFYKKPELRTIEQIKADIIDSERQTEGLLGSLISW
jgi:type I restriction enzyme M protein